MAADIMQRIDRQFREENDRQFDIMIGGTALALCRYHGWGQKRLMKFVQEVQDTWNECAEQADKSILMMLEEETGIELRLDETGKSYHELDFLNGNMDRKLENMSIPEIMYMRAQQMKWAGTTILASVMLSMHRIYGWGAERDTQLMHEIYSIRDEYKGKSGRIVRALKDETDISMGYIKQNREE